jgi:ring-1,2-phenylacetyl-CoA epoxidase subunit PaaC
MPVPVFSAMQPAPTIRFAYLTRFGDTALVLSQRLAELCGTGPALEEDMALANTALDLLGQARLWLTYAGEVEAVGRDEDALAYLRTDREFHNFLLVEQPNSDYAQVLMRQFYFDAWHNLALQRMENSADSRIAEIAAKSRKEAAYHLRRSSDLIVRLGDGTEDSHQLIQGAAEALWPFIGELFTGDSLDEAMNVAGHGFDPACLRGEWHRYVGQVFNTATLCMPAQNAWILKGGTQGVHTEHLSYLLAEMQVLHREYPGAVW